MWPWGTQFMASGHRAALCPGGPRESGALGGEAGDGVAVWSPLMEQLSPA